MQHLSEAPPARHAPAALFRQKQVHARACRKRCAQRPLTSCARRRRRPTVHARLSPRVPLGSGRAGRLERTTIAHVVPIASAPRHSGRAKYLALQATGSALHTQCALQLNLNLERAVRITTVSVWTTLSVTSLRSGRQKLLARTPTVFASLSHLLARQASSNGARRARPLIGSASHVLLARPSWKRATHDHAPSAPLEHSSGAAAMRAAKTAKLVDTKQQRGRSRVPPVLRASISPGMALVGASSALLGHSKAALVL